VFDGDAADDLAITLQSGTRPLAKRPGDRLRFETEELALPGATFQLRFSLRAEPPVAHVPNSDSVSVGAG
jgi:hypothetical protein